MTRLPAGSVYIALYLRSNLCDIRVQTTYLAGEVKSLDNHAARFMVVVITISGATAGNKACFLFVGIENLVPVVALEHGGVEIDVLQAHACLRGSAMHTSCSSSCYACQSLPAEINPLMAKRSFVVVAAKGSQKAGAVVLIPELLIEDL